MTDWKAVALALLFVYAMARVEKVNVRAMKFAGLFVLALAGYKTIPLLAPALVPTSPPHAGLADAPAPKESNVTGSPHSPAKLAELREARAGLVASIERLRARIEKMRNDPSPRSEPWMIEEGVGELEGNLDYERARLADIEAELASTGDAP